VKRRAVMMLWHAFLFLKLGVFASRLLYFDMVDSTSLFFISTILLLLKSRFQENEMSKNRENGRGNKRARVTRGSRNPNLGKRKHYIVHKPSRLN
jgi:hypothetical protein